MKKITNELHSNSRTGLILRSKKHLTAIRKLIARLPLYTLRRESKKNITILVVRKIIEIDELLDELTKDD